MGHIALCDGKGGTVEAKGRKYGVVADTVQNRGGTRAFSFRA
jgi:hypothetical protein